jgi:hypothetical protein
MLTADTIDRGHHHPVTTPADAHRSSSPRAARSAARGEIVSRTRRRRAVVGASTRQVCRQASRQSRRGRREQTRQAEAPVQASRMRRLRTCERGRDAAQIDAPSTRASRRSRNSLRRSGAGRAGTPRSARRLLRQRRAALRSSTTLTVSPSASSPPSSCTSSGARAARDMAGRSTNCGTSRSVAGQRATSRPRPRAPRVAR